MGQTIIIAIDGPAGAGKSSVAKVIAKKLTLEYVDSGAIYRAITKKILDSNIKINDYKRIENLLDKIEIGLQDNRVFIDSKDMTPHLRTRDVTLSVSPVSGFVPVRKKVNAFLNSYAGNKSIIMDGRDIGTVVFPLADYKFYLDAGVKVRALRRFKEKNTDMSLSEIEANITARDENDKNKPFGALKCADDAVYIETSDLAIDEVIQTILDQVQTQVE